MEGRRVQASPSNIHVCTRAWAWEAYGVLPNAHGSWMPRMPAASAWLVGRVKAGHVHGCKGARYADGMIVPASCIAIVLMVSIPTCDAYRAFRPDASNTRRYIARLRPWRRAVCATRAIAGPDNLYGYLIQNNKHGECRVRGRMARAIGRHHR